MAADSAGCTVTTVVTCEGDLADPGFRSRFDGVLKQLRNLLGEPLKVHKLEPWNSVRVTLSIPREAALRLRQLANDGSQQLRALGILSVQVEGDQVISLRLAGTSTSEPQEIVLRTGPQDGTTNGPSSSNLSHLLAGASESTVPTEKVQFPSPNVVCPPDSIVPKVPVQSASSNSTPPTTKGYAGPFPFTSMNQAMHSSRENASVSSVSSFTAPPPPYPGKHPPVTLSSPLLVNLLQNEGVPTTSRTVAEPTVSEVGPSQGMPPTFLANKTLRTVARTLPPNQHPTPQLQQQQPPQVPNVSLASTPVSSILSTVPHTTNKLVYTTNTQISQQPLPQRQLPVIQQQQKPPNIKDAIVTAAAAVAAAGKKTISSPVNNIAATARNPVPYNIYPPPYPNIINAPAIKTNINNAINSRQWEQSIQPMPQVQELVPSITDADLDHLLPSLERDLAGSPPDLPDDLLETKRRTVYLINPLTGELEPQSCSDSEEEFRDVFTGLPSPSSLSDEDTNSTIRPDTTDQSDSESRSCHSDSSKHSKFKARNRDKGRDSPSISKPTEKIKLRLKLEKSEPVSPAYKVDVSFINTQQPKKAITAVPASTPSPGEELRVPPLHISLRGRNHVVINNKKKVKLHTEKPKKLHEQMKIKKEGDELQMPDLIMSDQVNDFESRKIKKPKLAYENKEKGICLPEMDKKEFIYNSVHYTDKLMLRRGSDSDLPRTSTKKYESNGIILDDKKRRLSQSEDNFESQTTSGVVLGSTNVGTVTSIATHKMRKEKVKLKENFKNKDLNRFKSYSKNVADKINSKQVTLPTGEIDMEAKFKQRLMEDIQCMPHRTPPTPMITTTSDLAQAPPKSEIPKESTADEKVEDLIQVLTDPPPLKDKPPEPDKCNKPDLTNLQDKQPNRSPNSGAQGEDSGIESMDALSEKSPNQASQSPHAEISDPVKITKTQVPDILDIEAQLAKMEGLHTDTDDLNENQKMEECCVLESLTSSAPHSPPTVKEQLPEPSEPVVEKERKEDDLEPVPMRVTPPLYTYSNPEKARSESPTLSDSDSNLCNPIKKSMLEELLITIPDNQTPSSPSPATRSVRTRASSKLNSPELNSPVTNNKVKTAPTTKRKRHESESSNNSLEDQRNKKPRKCSENAAELIKACMGVELPSKAQHNAAPNVNNKKKVMEESSDSDEPLIEVAGKVKKSTQPNVHRVKVKAAAAALALSEGQTNSKTGPVNSRRPVRTTPTMNTRSKGDKSNPDSDVIRRKTRSAVSEGEGKRRKDVK